MNWERWPVELAALAFRNGAGLSVGPSAIALANLWGLYCLLRCFVECAG